MTINKEVKQILKDFKIDESQGLLCLLGIYFKLDVNTTCSEEVVKAINLTKIVVKDYNLGKTNNIVWNIPLFEGQEVAFDWVKGWNDKFGRLNPQRQGADIDAIKRMKEFFQKFPLYRQADIIRATDNYLKTVKDPQFILNSLNFIFEGTGGARKSPLLAWCEKLGISTTSNVQKGKIV